MHYVIGDWRFDPLANELANQGRVIRLEKRASETLTLLAERAGEVVSKQEILAAIWNGNAVSDHSVAIVISALRAALEDDKAAPKYIETVPKRGYRLVADVEKEMPSADHKGDGQAPPSAPPKGGGWWRPPNFPAAVLSALVFILVLAFSAELVLDAAAGIGPDDGSCPLEQERLQAAQVTTTTQN